MRSIAALILVSVVCLAATPADASDWSLDKWVKRESAWKGHGIGSTYTQTTTMQMPKIPNMPDVPGMPKGGKMVTTNKYTLTAIGKTAYTIKVETTSMGRKTTRTETEPKVRTVKLGSEVKDAGEGAVTVEGKSYTCKIKTVANMGAILGDSIPKGGPSAGRPQLGQGKIWEHPTLGVLKMETSMTVMGQSAKMTWLVSRLSVKHSIGTQSFTCREMTMSTTMQMGTSKVTMLSNPKFPGGTLKSTVESAMMGRKMTIPTVVTAYTKKPLTATTPAATK